MRRIKLSVPAKAETGEDGVMIACLTGDAGLFDRHFDGGLALDRLYAQNVAGPVTFLMVAAAAGHAEIVTRLLAGGASVVVLAPDGTQCSAVHAAAQESPNAETLQLLLATVSGDEELIYDPVEATDYDGYTALQTMYVNAQEGQEEMVIAKTRLLLDAGADPDGTRAGKYTPLMAACRLGWVDAAEVLLAAGAHAQSERLGKTANDYLRAALEEGKLTREAYRRLVGSSGEFRQEKVAA